MPWLIATLFTLLLAMAVAWLTWQNLLPLALVGFVVLIVTGGALVLFWHSPGILLLLYAIALPAYTLSLALLYQLSGSGLLVQAAQPWKEVLALLIITFLGIRVLAKLHVQQLHMVDRLVMAFFLLNFLYLFVPWGADFSARLFGMRANAFFVIIYWLGRLVPLRPQQQKWVLGLLLAVATLAGLFALVELLFLPDDWPLSIGLMDYLKDFFNVTPQGHYGLTWTFETSTGIRRRSAFFANPLELASSTLITGPAAFFLLLRYRPRSWGRFLTTAVFGLILLSLLLAVSRASLAAFFIQLFVITLWLRRWHLAFWLTVVGIIGGFLLLLVGGASLTDFILETITFQNPSSQGHLHEWQAGAEAMLAQPWGLGLGSSGLVGSRFGAKVGGENQFVIVGVELGVVGLVLYLSILLSTIWYALRTYRWATGTTQVLVFVAAAAKFGLLFPSFTAQIEIYVFTAFVSWWLAGFAIQQRVTMLGISRGRKRPFSSPQELSLANSH